VAERSSRKRRKQRQRPRPRPASGPEAMTRGYARGRQKDEEARAALKPLRPGERPLAVTVGAIAAGVLSLANLVALAVSYDSGESGKTFSTLLGSALLVLVAVGMWRARYWAVLGMQALLAISIILAALALLTAVNAWAAILALLIIATCGTLFWFLVKAMARIQLPPRPGASG
jgi:hypothetical protein